MIDMLFGTWSEGLFFPYGFRHQRILSRYALLLKQSRQISFLFLITEAV